MSRDNKLSNLVSLFWIKVILILITVGVFMWATFSIAKMEAVQLAWQESHESSQNSTADNRNYPATFLTYNERIECQHAIERVYWNYRIWPKENPDSKPLFEQVVNRELLQEKVNDSLKKNNALEYYWHKTITGKELQAELDRMAQSTKKPEMLKSLWDALGNDPHRIAECLVRPILVDKFIGNLYSYDTQYHGDLKQRVQNEVGSNHAVEQMKHLTGAYSETEWIQEEAYQKENEQPQIAKKSADGSSAIMVTEKEWHELLKKLFRDFNGQEADSASDSSSASNAFLLLNSIPLNMLSPVREDDNSFYSIAVLDINNYRIKIASVVWRKIPFEQWWDSRKNLFPVTIAEPVYDYKLPDILFATCGLDTWTDTSTTSAPAARSQHTAVWTGTEMIVWGGMGSAGNTGGRYNPGTDTWTATSTTSAPTARSGHSVVWTGTVMIIWGGSDVNTGSRYNPSTNSWTATTTTNAPDGRSNHTAVWTGTYMIIWGGNAGSLFFDTGGRYNPSTNSWTATTTTNAPEERIDHTAVWTGSEMIIWGGYGVTSYNNGRRYNPVADSWTATTTTNAPTARYRHTVVWTGTEMIVWGGNVGTNYFNTGGRYNPSTDSWTATTTTNAPTARTEHTAVWSDVEMIIWGGTSYTDTGGRYNPVTDTWASTTLTNVPSIRRYSTAVWTGTEMIIWGGDYNLNYFDTGSRYFPGGTGSWSATTTTNAPLARAYHTMIWTGAEAIVWGGYNGSNYFNTGARYYPATDSWSATPTTLAPSARAYHAAAWSGLQMIIWGGRDASTYFNTGSRYNPASNGWSATTVTGAPSERAYLPAVWSGTEMLVWGGYDGTTFFGDGSRYNPGTNSWTTITTTNAPSERKDHSTVWTGSQMIVWGGNFYDTSWHYLDTGSRYNPATNTWTATSTTSVPTGRSYHSAVWTGSQMVIWGGAYFDTAWHFLNTGGEYTSSSNLWSSTSTTNAPVARYRHSGVWADSEMIVWGGGSSVYYDDGGKYYPSTNLWLATPITNAPAARRDHAAVWTGSDMIVWGGFNGSYLNTGGKFCVVTCSAPVFGGVQSAVDPNGCAATGIQITWQQPSNWGNGADSGTYEIRRYTNATCTASYSAVINGLSAATTTFTDTSATQGVIYYYQVVAINNCTPTTSSTGTNDCSANVQDYPLVPSGLTNNTAADANTCADTGARVSWIADPANWGDGGSGTRRYDVLRNGTAIATALTYGTTTYIDTTGTNGVSNTYTVRYRNGCSLTATTTGASASDNLPSAPSGLTNNTAVDINPCLDTGVSITWTQDPADWGDSGGGTRTYNVVRNGTTIAGGLAYGTTSFIDTTGTNGITYTYTVIYVNGCGWSSITPGATAADAIAAIPSGLTNNTAADFNGCIDSGVRVTWTQNPVDWGDNGYGVRTFRVLRNSSPIGSSLSYGTTIYMDTAGTNSVTYTYTVRYANGCGLTADTSPGAPAADMIDDGTPCPNVGNALLITKSGINAVLNWTAVVCSDLSYYRVYGSSLYSEPFPTSWTVLGTPVAANFNDPLASSYSAYKILSVDTCGNTSSN